MLHTRIHIVQSLYVLFLIKWMDILENVLATFKMFVVIKKQNQN